jgi:phosphatidyl-myo-inositol alpha-mannosyltransferase
VRIGLVCPYDLGSAGGVQQLCTELAERLASSGDTVVLAGPGSAPGAVSLGNVIPVTANGSRVPISVSVGIGARLQEAMTDVDVIHLHEPLIPLVGWAALRSRLPMVLTFHADPPAWARQLYRRAPGWATGGVAGRVKTAVSAVAASAVPAGWGPVEIIPNAIDHGSYAIDVPRRPERVAFLGRDDPRKGLDVVLDAWPAVRREHPRAELVVIGTARSSGPEGVQFTGRVREPEKRSLLASSTVFVAPNLGGESFGIVLAEALAAGCAVAASDLPAFRAVAGVCATYVKPGDVGEWSETIITLLDSPDWVESLVRVGVRTAQAFDWPIVLDRYRDAYVRAVESV